MKMVGQLNIVALCVAVLLAMPIAESGADRLSEMLAAKSAGYYAAQMDMERRNTELRIVTSMAAKKPAVHRKLLDLPKRGKMELRRHRSLLYPTIIEMAVCYVGKSYARWADMKLKKALAKAEQRIKDARYRFMYSAPYSRYSRPVRYGSSRVSLTLETRTSYSFKIRTYRRSGVQRFLDKFR